MVLYVSLVDWYKQLVLCRCVWMEGGESCATVVGDIKKHSLSADNWGYLLLVSVIWHKSVIIVIIVFNLMHFIAPSADGELICTNMVKVRACSFMQWHWNFFYYSFKWYNLQSKFSTRTTLLKLPLLWKWIINNGLPVLLITMYSFRILSYWCYCKMCWRHCVR